MRIPPHPFVAHSEDLVDSQFNFLIFKIFYFFLNFSILPFTYIFQKFFPETKVFV